MATQPSAPLLLTNAPCGASRAGSADAPQPLGRHPPLPLNSRPLQLQLPALTARQPLALCAPESVPASAQTPAYRKHCLRSAHLCKNLFENVMASAACARRFVRCSTLGSCSAVLCHVQEHNSPASRAEPAPVLRVCSGECVRQTAVGSNARQLRRVGQWQFALSQTCAQGATVDSYK